MTNTISKVIHNGVEYEFSGVNGGVRSVNSRTGDVTGLAEDNAVVKLTGNQTVAGTKTFSTSPVVPSKTTAATNTGTAIATEAQVYSKADDSAVVKLTGNQTIAGVKTFSSSPVIPAPTNNTDASTKKYVDDTVAASKSSGSTAPSNPTQGQLWYDTTNNVLKVFDGTNWVEVGGSSGITNDTTGTTTTVQKIRAGTESEYSSITPNTNTIYYVF